MSRNPLLNNKLFDPYRWSTATQVESACNELQTILGLNDKRYTSYIMMVLLDLYWSWRTDPTQYVSFSRDKKRYGKNSRYGGIKFGYQCMKELTDKLMGQEYIEFVPGITYRDPVTFKVYAGYTSEMRATKKLIRLIVKHKVKLSMISRHPNEVVLKLRTEKDENEIARDVDLSDVKIPRDVLASEKVLKKYNDLLQRTYIDLDDEMLTEADLHELKRYDKKLECNVVDYTIDLSKKRVYRVFSNNDWKQGGRIYGAWWHGCPKVLRKYILLNGEPVVELDYSSIHVLLLYARLGENFLDDGVDAYKEEKDFERDVRKIVMMSAINAKADEKRDGDTKAVMATWDSLISKLNEKRVKHGITSHQSIYDMLETIKEKHPRINQFLGSGEGIKLMRMDSDIAMEVIKEHLDKNVPILSVHDSFIVPYWFKDFTIEIMNAAYGKMVAQYLGETYTNPIETIHFAYGVIDPKDTSGNMNVKKLIKPSCNAYELEDVFFRFKSRITSKQMKRQFKWDNTRYQISKVTRYEVTPPCRYQC